MHHWQHVLCSLLGSKEFWAAIVGAVVGGLFAVLTQYLSTLWQRKSERAAERSAVDGILQAIETEVELFEKKFLDSFIILFKEPNSNAPLTHLPKIVFLSQNLSTVFDSNAAVLGRLTDTTLRRKIVATYLTLKAIVDVVNYYAKRREDWEKVRYQPSTGGGLHEVKGELETWAEKLRRNIPELKTEIADLLIDIRKYLDRR